MKHLAFLAAGALIVAHASPALGAEPWDASTMATGGTYLTRSVDANSPYWNPANLHNTRGVLYFGSNFGLLLGNNALGVGDIYNAMQPQPTGQFGEFVKYLADVRDYRAGIEKAVKGNLTPATPPKAVALPIDKDFSAFVRGDAGIFGLNVAWGGERAHKKTYFDEEASKSVEIDVPERPNERGFAFRSYARAPGFDFFISGQDLVGAIDGVNKLDATMATKLIELNKQMQENALDFSTLGTKIDEIKKELDKGLAPLLKAEGNTLIIGVNQGAYLTNAVSYQMPLSDFAFMRPLLASRSVMVGTTVKVHTGLSAFGINPVGSALGSTFPGVDSSTPGRLEMVNKFDIKGPVNKLKAALDTFKDNPASASVVSDAATDFLNGHSMEFVSHKAGALGVSLDFGATMPLGYGFTLGAMLQNAPTIWPGEKITYQNTGTSGTFSFTKKGNAELENFSFTEPFGVRVGGGWEANSRAGGLGFSAELAEALDGPASRPLSLGIPSLHLGTHAHLLSVLYGRLGAQIGGKGNLFSVGTGLNFGIARWDFTVGTDENVRSVGFGTSLNVGL